MMAKRRKIKLVVYTVILFYVITTLIRRWKYSSLTSGRKSGDDQNVRPLNNNFNAFHIEKDVLVFWHIQRTGGTYFNTQLVKLDVSPSCQCSTEPPVEGACRCINTRGEQWLFSRLTTSSSCGVHPPLHDLALCVPAFLFAAEDYDKDKRKRYLFITVLREPIRRYLSEWQHLQRVPPWPSSCTGVKNPVESCLKAANHSRLSLMEFIQCPGNPANNRMARMLIKDTESLCDDLDYEEVLSAAKKALQSLAFFGLTDDEKNTRTLFEATFHVNFSGSVHQSNSTVADQVLSRNIDKKQLSILHEKNSLDIEIYAYAKSLFYDRLKS